MSARSQFSVNGARFVDRAQSEAIEYRVRNAVKQIAPGWAWLPDKDLTAAERGLARDSTACKDLYATGDYRIDRVVSHRLHGDGREEQYKVLWAGDWSKQRQCTWDPASNLSEEDVIEAYSIANAAAKRQKRDARAEMKGGGWKRRLENWIGSRPSKMG